MAQITPEHVGSRPAGEVGVGFEATEFIADRCCPVVSVPTMAGRISVFSRGDWARPGAQPVAARQAPPHVGYSLTQTTSFRNVKHGARTAVSIEVAQNADFDAKQVGTVFVRNQTELERETRCAAVIFADSWTNTVTLSGTDQWNDRTSSTPLIDISTAIKTVRDAIGRMPNTVLFGGATTSDILDHPDVCAIVRSNLAVKPQTILANYWRVAQVLFGEATYNAAAEGAADDFVSVWGPHCWIGYVNTLDASPEELRPSAIYTTRTGSKELTERVYTDEHTESAWIECTTLEDVLITANTAGYYIKAATAA